MTPIILTKMCQLIGKTTPLSTRLTTLLSPLSGRLIAYDRVAFYIGLEEKRSPGKVMRLNSSVRRRAIHFSLLFGLLMFTGFVESTTIARAERPPLQEIHDERIEGAKEEANRAEVQRLLDGLTPLEEMNKKETRAVRRRGRCGPGAGGAAGPLLAPSAG